MLRPTAVAVFPEEDYILRIIFDNGEKKRFDVSPYIGKGVFMPLVDAAFFSNVKVVLGTVQWPNGADLCPDTLYLDSEIVN